MLCFALPQRSATLRGVCTCVAAELQTIVALRPKRYDARGVPSCALLSS